MIGFASIILNVILIAGIGLWAWNHKAKAKKAAIAAVQAVKDKMDAEAK
jgi:hypothetical protein